ITSSAFRGVATAQMRGGYDPITKATFAVTNPIAQYFFAHPELYPLPNQAATALLGQDYLGTQDSFIHNNQGDVKIDWQARPKDLVSERVTVGRDQEGITKLIIPTDIPSNSTAPACSLNPLPNVPTPCKLPLIGVLPLVTQVSYTESEAVMNYNALQTTFRRQLSHGLEALANYTFSKSFSDNKGYYGAGGTAGANN